MGFSSRNSTDSQSEDMRKAPFWLWLGKKKRSHYNTPEASPMTKSSSLGKKPYHWNIYPTWGKGIATTLIPAGSSIPIKLKKKKTKQNSQEGTGFQGNGLGMLQLGKGVGDRVERKPCPQRGTEILVIPEIWAH